MWATGRFQGTKPIEVDLEEERAAAKERRQARFNEGMRSTRALEVVEAAAPSVNAKAFIKAARKHYARLPWSERKKIVQVALKIAAEPKRPGRPGRRKKGSTDPLRKYSHPPRQTAAAPKEVKKDLPTMEDVMIAPPAAPANPQAAIPAKDRFREPVLAIIAPLLDADPALTPSEARERVQAAGVKVSYSTFQLIWLEYLEERALLSPELKKARASRAAKLRASRRREGRGPVTPRAAQHRAKAAEMSGEVAAPVVEAPRVEAADVPPLQLAQLPTPAPIMPDGISLSCMPGDKYRLQLDVTVEIPPARAFHLAAVVASALHAALDEEAA